MLSNVIQNVYMKACIIFAQTCQPYWPDEDEPKQKYGPLEVELKQINAENNSKSFITRDFKVRLAEKVCTSCGIQVANYFKCILCCVHVLLMAWSNSVLICPL